MTDDGRATVERYVLGQQPEKFIQQPEILTRLKAVGVSVLPVTVVNGEVRMEHGYPTYAHLKQWIEDGTTRSVQGAHHA